MAADAPAPFDSTAYWRKRYAAGGNSGAGAYGRLAVYKAYIVNVVTESRGVGRSWSSVRGTETSEPVPRPRYTGVDVSPEALARARERLGERAGWRLMTLDEYEADLGGHDIALSLDVIYHLIEDEVFEAYMRRLFEAATRFVLIYSSDHEETLEATHVRHRRYSSWIEGTAPAWKLGKTWKQPFAFEKGADPRHTSFAFFRLFRRPEGGR
jgi:hypothetical protein